MARRSRQCTRSLKSLLPVASTAMQSWGWEAGPQDPLGSSIGPWANRFWRVICKRMFLIWFNQICYISCEQIWVWTCSRTEFEGSGSQNTLDRAMGDSSLAQCHYAQVGIFEKFNVAPPESSECSSCRVCCLKLGEWFCLAGATIGAYHHSMNGEGPKSVGLF